MAEQTVIPKWFYAIAIIAVLWNLLGLAAFTSDMMMTPERLAEMEHTRQQMYAAIPSWTYIPYGLSVIAGAIGSIGLLLRKHWSIPVLGVSLFGVIIQQGYFFGFSGLSDLVSGAEKGFSLVILLIAIFLVWFAVSSKKAGRFEH